MEISKIRETGIKYAPDSSTVARCTYSPDDRLLLVDFKNGGSYVYCEVTTSDWQRLVDAESPGGSIAKSFRGKFETKKVVKNEDGKEVAQ